MKHLAILVALLGWSSLMPLIAQSGKDRYRFAQSYLGAQAETYTNGQGHTILGTRLIVGGLHFWKHADFYVSFPLFSHGLEVPEETTFTPGIITGARYLPWAISGKGPRPILGIQWLTPSFRQGDGGMWNGSRLGLELGFNWALGRSWTIELLGNALLDPSVRYSVSRQRRENIQIPHYGVSLAVKKYVDFTAAIGSESGQKYARESERYFEEKGALSTWNVAAGVSANLALSAYPFTESVSFVPRIPPIRTYPDLALGYYLRKPDLAVRLAYRPVRMGQEAYGYEWFSREHRLGLEVIKFTFDYHGFVPFVGIGVGGNHTRMEIRDRGRELLKDEAWIASYALVFGWDIRPNDAQWFILRTNLRYLFDTDASLSGQPVSTNQLEINFIQFVFYPARFKHRKL